MRLPSRAKATSAAKTNISGKWRIREMDLWDQEAIDLLGLLVATCEERLVESHGLGGSSRDELRELVLDGSELADEGGVGVVGDEASWRERRLDQVLHLAGYGTRGPLHRRRRFVFVFGLDFAVGCSSSSEGIALKRESSPW